MRIAVTEIEKFQECELAHYYKYGLGLRFINGNPPDYLRAGKAISDVLEAAFLDRLDTKQCALGLAENVPVDIRGRVLKALGAMPEWVWEVQLPMPEDKLEYNYPVTMREGKCEAVTFVGKPDLWFVESSSGLPEAVRIMEFKAPSKNRQYEVNKSLEGYERFGVQPIRYAVLLRDVYEWLENVPIYRQHILISQYGLVAEGNVVLVSDALIDRTRREMLEIASRMYDTTPVPSYLYHCHRCEFSEVCIARLTGGDESGIIETNFERRQRD